jgi:uncharacterized lipoprotein YddW (UPF0748 family)
MFKNLAISTLDRARVEIAAGVVGMIVGVAPVMAAPDAQPPVAPREFRAAWVATVENIDWPSKKTLSTQEQKAEINAILDKSVELNINCIVLQVRTACDALYPSKIEPWSVYLTGTQGQRPKPYYDPLKMWIDEAHKRGIELHAWFNPYRARTTSKLALSNDHVSKKNPTIVKEYGGYLWLDPGAEEAAKQSLAVFNDVVKRYDVDGIHIDDYFYPYPVQDKEKKDVPFPDDESWAKYQATGGTLERDDWRRENVNRLIHDIYTSTKKIKPHVKFGISPFGIGRPGTAPGITGFDQYTKLYADAALWLNNGWCDYFAPQLYWPIEKKEQSFPVLLDYWKTENRKGVHIYPGLFTSRIGDKERAFPMNEIVDQIKVTCEHVMNAPGHIHFSMKAIMQNREGLADALKSGVYAQPALVPASTWLDNAPPGKPSAKLVKKTKKQVWKLKLQATELQLSPGRGEKPWQYAIWKYDGSAWKFQVIPGKWKAVQLEPNVTDVVVTAVDRSGNESERVSAGVK